jgi:hypothetical protein
MPLFIIIERTPHHCQICNQVTGISTTHITQALPLSEAKTKLLLLSGADAEICRADLAPSQQVATCLH